MTLIIILVIVVSLGLFVVSVYNGLVRARNEVKNAWSSIDVQLKRRHDLIPNLVETVKGYATYESGVFEAIAESRSKLAGARTPEDTIAAANQQSSALARLLAISENYPQLKANEQFNRLSDELAGTENRIATERKRYNDKVQEYNTLRSQFPSNVTGKIFGIKKEYPFFQAPPEAKQLPKVNFGK